MRAAGGNHRTIRRYAEDVWRIPIDHFDPARAPGALRERGPARATCSSRGPAYHRGHLKERLLRRGSQAPALRAVRSGRALARPPDVAVLDHINGVHDDNRLENLRIVCPNCNATLDTHCGRNKTRQHAERACLHVR